MKTPREILTARHRSADAKLDALRHEVVAEYVAAPRLVEAGHQAHDTSVAYLARKLWQELVLPCRQIWLGLGAAWLIILAAHFAVPDAGNTRELMAAKPAPSGPEMMAALKQQKIWMNQMLEPAAPPTANVTAPGPRSERRMELVVV
jgi:hypothetical protein